MSLRAFEKREAIYNLMTKMDCHDLTLSNLAMTKPLKPKAKDFELILRVVQKKSIETRQKACRLRFFGAPLKALKS